MVNKTQVTSHTHCPKCNSKLFLDKDQVGYYFECILCGYTHDLPDPNSKPLTNSKNLKD